MKKIINILSSKILKLIHENFKIYNFNNDNFIQKKKIKKFKNVNVFIIKKGKVFTNSNEDAAYLKDNLVLAEPSYQYRNSKNLNIKKNFIFKNGINRLKKKYNGKIISIISGGAAKHNYGHWLFDSISKLLIILKNKKFKDFDYLYVPSYRYKFQKEILRYLNIYPKKSFLVKKTNILRAVKLFAQIIPLIIDLIKFLNQ